MRFRKFRLSIDFSSLEALREFAAIMDDRTELPEGAVVREQDALDDRGGGIARFIWAQRRGSDTSPGEVVYPELAPRWERQSLQTRLARLGACDE